MNLGELAGHGTTMEFVNRLLGQILPASDVDGLEPAPLTPAPRRDGRDTNLLQPTVQGYDRSRIDWIILIMRFLHTAILQIWQRLGVDRPTKTRVLFI